MRRQSSGHKRLIAGIGCITASLLIGLSIVSYNTTDYESPWMFKTPVENVMGRGGAIISYYLINWTFGYTVLIPAALLLLWGWRIIRKKPVRWLKRFSVYGLCTMLLISYILAVIGEFAVGGSLRNYEYSGSVGGFFASYSAVYLGKAGTYIVAAALSLILVVLWSNFRIWNILNRLRNGADYAWRFRKKPAAWIKTLLRECRRKWKLARSTGKESPKKNAVSGIRLVEKQKDVRAAEAGTPEGKPFIPIKDRIAAQSGSITIRSPKETETAPTIHQPEAGTGTYSLPPLELLDDPPAVTRGDTKEDILHKADILETTLLDFGVRARVSEVHPGPVLTLFEVLPDTGVKVNKILALQDDLARTMQARGIRIIAPIPGRDTVGVEIPNNKSNIVYLKNMLSSPAFQRSRSKLSIAMGKTITGDVYIADLAKMPHLLIAGSTGSGKSVGISTLVTSILYKSEPRDVQFVMIDPKMLELTIFKKLKAHHLLTADFLNEQVVTRPENAVLALRSCVAEMEKRYELLARIGVRNIDDYNAKLQKPVDLETGEPFPEKLEYLVIIIDELADLMLVASKDVEEPIARLAQMARAVGIHLVLATQRPSVDVLTGVIKANFPARIAYQVAQKVDSRTILDMNGAEQLLGQGDMLYLPPGSPKPVRLQNPFISARELERVIQAIAAQPKFLKTTKLTPEAPGASGRSDSGIGENGSRDPLFSDAARLVVIHQQGSISLLQRRLKIGYSRAARLIDELEDAGVVGPYDGSKARQVLIEDEDDLTDLL